MEKELQGKLVEVITGLQTAVGRASDFAMEQLPDIAQSYVMYGRITETVFLLLFLLLTGLGIFLLYKAVSSKDVNSWGDWAAWRIVISIFGGVTLVLGVIPGFFMQIPATTLVWFAPKVWLIKELAALVK